MHFQLIQKDRNSTTLQELSFLLIAKKKPKPKPKKQQTNPTQILRN